MLIWILILIFFVLANLFCFLFSLILEKKCNKREKNKSEEKKESFEGNIEENKIRTKLSCLCMGFYYWFSNCVGHIPSHIMRNFIYRAIFRMKIGKDVVIYGKCQFRDLFHIKIGKGTIIGDGVRLDGRNGIDIGENVNISSEACFWTEQHDVNDSWFRCLKRKNREKNIVIENRAWISCRTIILPGVRIGEGAVIAAGAVVTKDAEAYGIYAGNPAVKIGSRNDNLQYEFSGKHLGFY